MNERDQLGLDDSSGRAPRSAARYGEDAATLAQVGEILDAFDLPLIHVRLPRAMAERAVAAWERDDAPWVEGGEPETTEERLSRMRAGTLALIGLTIESAGRWEGDEVVVALHPRLIGAALEAAEW